MTSAISQWDTPVGDEPDAPLVNPPGDETSKTAAEVIKERIEQLVIVDQEGKEQLKHSIRGRTCTVRVADNSKQFQGYEHERSFILRKVERARAKATWDWKRGRYLDTMLHNVMGTARPPSATAIVEYPRREEPSGMVKNSSKKLMKKYFSYSDPDASEEAGEQNTLTLPPRRPATAPPPPTTTTSTSVVSQLKEEALVAAAAGVVLSSDFTSGSVNSASVCSVSTMNSPTTATASSGSTTGAVLPSRVERRKQAVPLQQHPKRYSKLKKLAATSDGAGGVDVRRRTTSNFPTTTTIGGGTTDKIPTYRHPKNHRHQQQFEVLSVTKEPLKLKGQHKVDSEDDCTRQRWPEMPKPRWQKRIASPKTSTKPIVEVSNAVTFGISEGDKESHTSVLGHTNRDLHLSLLSNQQQQYQHQQQFSKHKCNTVPNKVPPPPPSPPPPPPPPPPIEKTTAFGNTTTIKPPGHSRYGEVIEEPHPQFKEGTQSPEYTLRLGMGNVIVTDLHYAYKEKQWPNHRMRNTTQHRTVGTNTSTETHSVVNAVHHSLTIPKNNVDGYDVDDELAAVGAVDERNLHPPPTPPSILSPTTKPSNIPFIKPPINNDEEDQSGPTVTMTALLMGPPPHVKASKIPTTPPMEHEEETVNLSPDPIGPQLEKIISELEAFKEKANSTSDLVTLCAAVDVKEPTASPSLGGELSIVSGDEQESGFTFPDISPNANLNAGEIQSLLDSFTPTSAPPPMAASGGSPLLAVGSMNIYKDARDAASATVAANNFTAFSYSLSYKLSEARRHRQRKRESLLPAGMFNTKPSNPRPYSAPLKKSAML